MPLYFFELENRGITGQNVGKYEHSGHYFEKMQELEAPKAKKYMEKTGEIRVEDRRSSYFSGKKYGCV